MTFGSSVRNRETERDGTDGSDTATGGFKSHQIRRLADCHLQAALKDQKQIGGVSQHV